MQLAPCAVRACLRTRISVPPGEVVQAPLRNWDFRRMREPLLQIRELPDTGTCWALLERIASSSHVKRAARLQELLFYLGKCSLKDGLDTVHEQRIGVDVFGRSDDYDTSDDNIVRTNVSEL